MPISHHNSHILLHSCTFKLCHEARVFLNINSLNRPSFHYEISLLTIFLILKLALIVVLAGDMFSTCVFLTSMCHVENGFLVDSIEFFLLSY